jgi:hypothetical protein
MERNHERSICFHYARAVLAFRDGSIEHNPVIYQRKGYPYDGGRRAKGPLAYAIGIRDYLKKTKTCV